MSYSNLIREQDLTDEQRIARDKRNLEARKKLSARIEAEREQRVAQQLKLKARHDTDVLDYLNRRFRPGYFAEPGATEDGFKAFIDAELQRRREESAHDRFEGAMARGKQVMKRYM